MIEGKMRQYLFTDSIGTSHLICESIGGDIGAHAVKFLSRLVGSMQIRKGRPGIEYGANILLQFLWIVVDCKSCGEHALVHHGTLRMPRLGNVVEKEFNLCREGRIGTNLIKDATRLVESHAHFPRKGTAQVLEEFDYESGRWIAEKANTKRMRWKWRRHDCLLPQ